jgi:CRP-like cAMP-binding protein
MERIGNKLTPFDLVFGEVIYEAGEAIKKVYFPNVGLVSLLATLDGASVLEVGVVSSEGVVGLSVFLGAPDSRTRALVQGEGSSQSMKVADFHTECKTSPALSSAVLKYTNKLLAQVSQSAICYRFHKIDARLARWLLLTSDCMRSNKFKLTQEFLSHMLGVRREAVTTAAHRFQELGVLNYSRGTIDILDRKKLEATACPCYAIIKKILDN